MSKKPLRFRHEVIDSDPPGSEHDILLITDVNGNGRNDIIIGGKTGEYNLFWYENPTWRRHMMAVAPGLEAGGVLVDVAGNGRLDVVAGQQYDGTELYWFEHPEDPTQLWPRHVIEDRFVNYHDQLVADVDGDGETEIVALSQGSGVLVYYDIPREPRVSPWPRECCHVMAAELPQHQVEGLAFADLDGDGRKELVAGQYLLRPKERSGDSWEIAPYAREFEKPRVQVADLDGDGLLEIVLAEGESHPARLAICHAPGWEPRLLRTDLFHPHSLEIADFDGDGRADILVGEMGLGRNPDPKLMVFRNLGEGAFEETVIQRGVATHEAKVGDLTGDGRPDIAGKPYHPERHIDVWFNETE